MGNRIYYFFFKWFARLIVMLRKKIWKDFSINDTCRINNLVSLYYSIKPPNSAVAEILSWI